MLYFLAVSLGVFFCSCVFGAILFWLSVAWRYQRNKPVVFTPNVCVLVPCKKTDSHFSENIQAFCHQKYPMYRVLCIVDSVDDPAYADIQQIISAGQNNVSVVITKVLKECSGKISALLTGVKHAKNADVLVFADSDIKPHTDWLRQLVAPLHDCSIGASTGYRWYFPDSIRSYLISAWNALCIIFMFSSFNFTWGGSTAIRRELFEHLDIEKKWRRGFSDDLILTKAIKNACFKIKMVPQSVAESSSETDFISFVRWGTRQFTWIQWYHPFFRVCSLSALFGLIVFFMLSVMFLFQGILVPALFLLCVFLLTVLYGCVTLLVMRKTILYPKKKFGSVCLFSVMMPVTLLLFFHNALMSCFKQRIVWHGRSYQVSDMKKGNGLLRNHRT